MVIAWRGADSLEYHYYYYYSSVSRKPIPNGAQALKFFKMHVIKVEFRSLEHQRKGAHKTLIEVDRVGGLLP